MRLVADNLAVERGGEIVLRDLSVDLESGALLVVTGANGSGKSTLLKALAGLLPLAEGTVRLESADNRYETAGAASQYLGHQNAMKPAMTVAENLAFWQEFLGEPDVAIDDALDFMGLSGIGALPFATLSTGQRRRVAIARLLVAWRPIWLLDEPTAGLDRASERQFARLMRAHLDEGGMIVAATHVDLGLAGRELRLGSET